MSEAHAAHFLDTRSQYRRSRYGRCRHPSRLPPASLLPRGSARTLCARGRRAPLFPTFLVPGRSRPPPQQQSDPSAESKHARRYGADTEQRVAGPVRSLRGGRRRRRGRCPGAAGARRAPARRRLASSATRHPGARIRSFVLRRRATRRRRPDPLAEGGRAARSGPDLRRSAARLRVLASALERELILRPARRVRVDLDATALRAGGRRDRQRDQYGDTAATAPDASHRPSMSDRRRTSRGLRRAGLSEPGRHDLPSPRATSEP